MNNILKIKIVITPLYGESKDLHMNCESGARQRCPCPFEESPIFL